MTDVQLSKLMQEEYDAQKMTQGTNNQYVQAKNENGPKDLFHNKSARQQVAEAHGVGERTVRNAISFGHGLDAADSVFFSFSDSIIPRLEPK